MAIDPEMESRVNERQSCGDCACLIEALREVEQQCREAEDECLQLEPGNAETEQRIARAERQLEKIKKLEHRRNCALEVLLKHQALEH